MAKIFSRLVSILRLNFSEQADREIDIRRDALGAEMASRFGRGNTTIQDGGALTNEDIDSEILQLRGLKFGR